MTQTHLPDAIATNWVDRHAPPALVPWLKLGRFDRPTGIWLLMLPGWMGVALADASVGRLPDPVLLLLILIGATLMRSAGCAFSDIVDRDIDAKVERTARRPIPAGEISVKQAWLFIVLCSLGGLIILLSLNLWAVGLGVLSLGLVAAYPFMKRITWWPQAWLGIVFSWGALVGWTAVARAFGWPMALLYAGAIAWVIGYDTIYALQDREDDALIGVRSSALRMGRHVRGGVASFYLVALILWSVAIWLIRPEPLAFVALVPAAMQLAWQVLTLDPDDGEDALAKFRSNRFAGLLVFLACATVGTGAP